MKNSEKTTYKHYLAIDWSIEEVYTARMLAQGEKIETKKFDSDIRQIKKYLMSIKELSLIHI